MFRNCRADGSGSGDSAYADTNSTMYPEVDELGFGGLQVESVGYADRLRVRAVEKRDEKLFEE